MGRGSVALVEGPAGIGKTRLLTAARELAAERGLRVLSAQGSELERDFPFGAVLQLLVPPVAAMSADEQARAFDGGAAHARPLLLGGGPDGAARDSDFATPYGLYWLLVAVSQRDPLLLTVDDVHWLDAPSLRFLGFLARRLDGMRVLVCAALRPAEPGTDRHLLTELALGAETLRPAPLTRAGAGAVIAAEMGAAPPAAFVDACHEATGGNPFYLRAAARAGDPELGSDELARLLLRRLTALGHDVPSLARALAILGDGATLPQAAALAGLELPAAAAAADALERAEIARTGAPRPGLAFVHPIVRTSIYRDIAPSVRAERHRAAARLVDGERVVAQLLLAGPPDAWAVEQLRAAAARAIERGAPEHARACLRHALDGPGDRVEILLELATAETALQDPAALEHLQAARALVDDPVRRTEIAVRLAELLVYAGAWDAAVELAEAARAELDGRDADLDLHLRTRAAAAAAYDPRLAAGLTPRLAELRTAALGGGRAGRPLALLLAAVDANRGERLDEVAALVEHGLDGGRLLVELPAETWCFPQALMGLIGTEQLGAATRLVEAMVADAQARGSVRGFIVALGMRAYVRAFAGDLPGVEADLRAALALAQEHAMLFGIPSALRWGLDAILERPALAELVTLAETLELPPALAGTLSGAWMHELRGRLATDRGDAAEALRTAGRIFDELGFRNVGTYGWRGALALATGDPAPALAELADAERIGLPRGIGVAQRTLGLLEGSTDRLRTAAEILAPVPLEQARALVELGAALRRANQRKEARDPLRRGLDLAVSCGAQRLADRARAELRAAGARPRREALTGRAALTPSELRIVDLAADGLSNPAIAQALFVTVKTVEGHLSSAYRKLGIRSRAELRT